MRLMSDPSSFRSVQERTRSLNKLNPTCLSLSKWEERRRSRKMAKKKKGKKGKKGKVGAKTKSLFT